MVPCRAPGPCCGTVQPVRATAVVEPKEIRPSIEAHTQSNPAETSTGPPNMHVCVQVGAASDKTKD